MTLYYCITNIFELHSLLENLIILCGNIHKNCLSECCFSLCACFILRRTSFMSIIFRCVGGRQYRSGARETLVDHNSVLSNLHVQVVLLRRKHLAYPDGVLFRSHIRLVLQGMEADSEEEEVAH